MSHQIDLSDLGRVAWLSKNLPGEIVNAVVFMPGDVAEAVAMLGCLELHSSPRSAFIEKWRRDTIMDEMASEVWALVNNET